jgi:WD40 repeat protein
VGVEINGPFLFLLYFHVIMNLLLVVVFDKQEGVTCLAWLGSSKYVASGCVDGMVLIWDSLSGELARVFSGHREAVQSLAISADGNSLISVSSDKSARVFDISMFK